MTDSITDAVDRIFDAVARTATEVRDGLAARRSRVGGENPSGDTQLEADRWADERFAAALADLDCVGTYASEERADALDCGDGLSVAVDPLDGSKNLESNNCLGTIVGVYDAALPAAGRDVVAAGFVLYGPVTTMVTAVDGRVTESLVEAGARRPVETDLALPAEPTVYAIGGQRSEWPASLRALLDRDLKCRYGGAFVGDISQVLTFGGIYAYPAVDGYPNGKLRLQFEAAPLAYVVESAGGRSTDGERSLLDVPASAIHQRTPVYLGDGALVASVESDQV